MTKVAAQTGIGPTAAIAIEQYFPRNQRIVEDNLAYRILPPIVRALIWTTRFDWVRSWMIGTSEKYAPGIWGGVLCRKRYIDEKISEAINQIDAVVNLGTGFDTRAYRLPALAKVPVWEVDQPENIKPKRAQLEKLFGEVPTHVTLVAIDFDREDLDAVLASHGYSADRRTFFILEAVTQYLTETGIRTMFDFLAKAAPGSRLAFTYVRKDFIDGRVMYNWERGYKQYVTKNIWLFGMDPEGWPNFLEKYGWRVIEDVGYDELAKRYIEPAGRVLTSTSVERMVYAEKL